MNGVRRLLGGGGTQRTPSPPSTVTELPTQSTPPPPPIKPTPPLVISGKPSWPPLSLSQGPQSPSQNRDGSPVSSPINASVAFLARKEARPSLSDDGSPRQSYASNVSPVRKPLPTSMMDPPPSSTLSQSSPVAGPSSPRASPARVTQLSRKTVTSLDTSWKRSSGFVDTRDQMLMSLLASEAVVDSRDSEIMSAEEVEELKKEQQVLESRLGAMAKKLTLETKIRDAALSLSRVNAAHKGVSKQTTEQLDAANRKVETVQKELWRVSERANEIQRKLLEHRAGVLSTSLRSLEAKVSGNIDGSGYTTPQRSSEMSPTSSVTSMSASSKSKFDGAHFFAGHADALRPVTSRKPLSAAEVAVLEDKLREATGRLEVATKMQAETKREISHLRLEKTEVETSMSMELQAAADTISAMESELHRLEALDSQVNKLTEEREEWIKERIELEETRKEVELLERRLEVMEEQSGEAVGMEALLMQVKEESQLELERKESEIQELRAQWEAERIAWEKHKMTLEDEKSEAIAQLQEEKDNLRGQESNALRQANAQLQTGFESLQRLVQSRGVVHTSRDMSISTFVTSLEVHLDDMSSKMEDHNKSRYEWETQRRDLDEGLKISLDKREALIQEIEEARREREEARREVRNLEVRIKDQSDRFSDIVTSKSPASPAETNTDVKKLIGILQPVWAALPSPETRASKFGARKANSPTVGPGSPTIPASSLSDLDVRSLKTLYDGRQTYPTLDNLGPFSVEAFASRVQALMADDRALIERLTRFAQAHDLLKKNAERAQKLAQESSLALETYQKQVKALEERNMTLASSQAILQDDVHQLQEAIDRITAEKRDVEMQAAEQAETCQQLTEANNTLSAKILSLAAEGVATPEVAKKQLERQLAECKSALDQAQGEVDAMRMSEQSQRVALLDELNSMQTENGNLRAQLRAAGKR